MSVETPHLTPDEFLLGSMRNELKVEFEEFMVLWQSSESLRLLIRQAVVGSESDAAIPNDRLKKDRERQTLTDLPSKQNDVVQSMIAKGAMSPALLGEALTQPHGGLSRKQLLLLLDQFKAGKRSLGTYMLVRAWKKQPADSGGKPNIRLKKLSLDCLGRAIAENRADFFEEIANTIRFLQEEEYQDNGRWKHDPGQWWQFHLLLYILEHPKQKYAMREFVAYFTDEVGANEMPTTKTIRSFCRSQGIMLDSSPGAPKKTKRPDA